MNKNKLDKLKIRYANQYYSFIKEFINEVDKARLSSIDDEEADTEEDQVKLVSYFINKAIPRLYISACLLDPRSLVELENEFVKLNAEENNGDEK